VAYARYHEAVDYLQRRLWQELPIMPVERALQTRIRRLLDHFGEPQRAMRIVHVGGSAGKGSVATMTASILQAAGLSTGLYTSPHLQTFIERAAVDGVLIDPAIFAERVMSLDPLVRQMHIEVLDGIGFGRPSLVEVAFAAGMRHFADERCDAAVVEVGLGGRTDCTNIFEQPDATVLTNVELEHRERLGPDIASISREKAAIIKGGIAVTGARRREALDVIEARCREVGADLWRLGPEIGLRVRTADACGSTIDVRTPHATIDHVRVALAGAHQARNAALATAAAQTFAYTTGRSIDESAIRHGLASVRLSGRLEVVQCEPEVLLDGAHNPAEARALAKAVQAHWACRGRRIILLAGILGDKERAPMVSALSSFADRVIVTRPPLDARAGYEAAVAAMFAKRLGSRRVRLEAAPNRALDATLDEAKPGDLVVIAGSMFLVGALRGRWVPEQRILKRRTAALS
jgi:dihydrofolate synthase/folylpolyglutamate synthase